MQVCQNLKSIHDCNLGYTVQKIKYKRPFKDHFHLLPQHLQPTLVFQNVSFRKGTQYFANIFQFHWWNDLSSQNTQGPSKTPYENRHWWRWNSHLPTPIYTLGSISVNFRCFAHKIDWNKTVNICSSSSALTHWLHDFMRLQLKLHLI